MFTTTRRVGLATALTALVLGAPTTSPVEAADEPPSSLLAACPIEGDHDLIDSWGWRRSGGRSHQGIDIGADYGTELYAVRDGWANFKRSNLGGNAVWLTTDDGDRFYYAHLDSFVGDDRDVVAGELIGYVGSTGNAGGPHLHFETHPAGAVENPFDHVVAACTRQEPPTPTAADDAAAGSTPTADGSAIDAFVRQLRDDQRLIERGVGIPERSGTPYRARPI